MEGYPYPTGWVRFDPKEAKKLLAEAGYPNGKGFPDLTLSYNTSEAHKAVAETIQQMWKKHLGIEIALENRETKTHFANLDNHQYQIARIGGVGEFMYPTTFFDVFITGAKHNRTQWTHPKFDEMWDTVSKETNVQKRLEIYSEMEKLLLQESPEIPIYYYPVQWLAKPYVKNLNYNPTYNFLLKEVWLEK